MVRLRRQLCGRQLERPRGPRGTLAALETQLDPAVFVRSHRSTIVNLSKVRETASLSDGSWRLTTRSGAELVASRTYRDAVLSRLHGQGRGTGVRSL